MAGKNKERKAALTGPQADASRRRKRLFKGGVVLTMLIVAVAAAWGLVWIITRPASTPPAGPPTVTIGHNVFNVELAINDRTRMPGLGKRAALPADYGMLFVYPTAHPAYGPHQIGFWMKDCLIDLDIAFISPDRRIVTIYTMKAQPAGTPDDELKTYPADRGMQFALETTAGEFARRGIKVGDRVEFSEPVEASIAQAE